LKRLVAVAVLSMSTALAGVGASYGQDKVVRIGRVLDVQTSQRTAALAY